jgi:hypothetical protein
MHLKQHLRAVPLNVADQLFLLVAWLLVGAKCFFVAWAFEHWHIPLNVWWIIAPTLALAVLATILWITHRD